MSRILTGRLLTALAWAVLVLGLWLWGRAVTEVRTGPVLTTTGDMAAVGRPPEVELPSPARPLAPARPQRVDIPALGVQAPVVETDLDRTGAVETPPYDQAGMVGWYAAGVRPGAAGAAVMVGHLDTEERPAVFRRLSTLTPGDKVRVTRADGRLAEFTVEDVEVVDRDRFDAHRAYGPREKGRAELRLISCAGDFDRATGGYTANVIVSAYLTHTQA
jgi:sortase (surface protein transpeptidase)